MTYMQINESKSHSVVHDIYAETLYNWVRIQRRSMTNMQINESKSNPVVNDIYAFGQ